MSRVVIGIDPGLDGALAYACNEGTYVVDMPTVEVTVNGKTRRRLDPYGVKRILIDWGRVDLVVLEEATSRPGEGSVGAFAYGKGAGILEGLLVALERPYKLVRPQVWTKALGVGADKGVHREAAMRLFPELANRLSLKKHDGRADALLMAYWGRK
jgi:crossover junction endodeoxyribonuclease RuvC